VSFWISAGSFQSVIGTKQGKGDKGYVGMGRTISALETRGGIWPVRISYGPVQSLVRDHQMPCGCVCSTDMSSGPAIISSTDSQQIALTKVAPRYVNTSLNENERFTSRSSCSQGWPAPSVEVCATLAMFLGYFQHYTAVGWSVPRISQKPRS